MKVLVSDHFSREGLAIFEQYEGLDLDYQPGLSTNALLKAVAEVDALVVRGGTLVTEELFGAAGKLRIVGRAGIGAENIDLDAADRHGVVVVNTPFGSKTTTAEHTIAMLMALARMIPQAHASVQRGEWDQQRFLGIEIAGKTLGVLGAGKIGRIVIERARSLKMRVLVYDPYLTAEAVRHLGAEQVGLDELVARSDFMSLHMPRNAETENILGEEQLAAVKPGCRIVNCAMGGLVDEQALAEAISTGRVAGAAIDVFAKEPPPDDHPLLGLDQVIVTPHLRAATRDAQTNVAVQLANQVVNFLRDGVVENAMNVPAIHADLLESIRPYLVLAEKLGAFQAQYQARGVDELTIEYSGAVTEYPMEPLTRALLKGFLTPMVGAMVNYVNAPHLARERGIRLVEAKSSTAEGFANQIRLIVHTADGESSVCGTLFGEQEARIVRVHDFSVEAIPSGHILVLRNYDRPGVIGFIGQMLSEANINIAMMNLSRRKINGQAISLLTVDSKIPERTLETLRSNENILSAIQVEL
ncbi:MAG: phosphoglycerate dehydrogenase [Desulfuromonadales bacterium]